MNKQVFILFIFTFLTLSSILPLNNSFTNDNSQLSSKSNGIQSHSPVSPNAKLSSIVNPASVYSYNQNFSVTGFVDQIYYIVNIQGGSASAWQNYLWWVPTQQVEVYIGMNPCVNRTVINNIPQCNAETSLIANYKLKVTAGTGHTGGTDALSQLGVDDNLGILDTTTATTAQKTTYNNTLQYNFQVQMPNQTEMSNLGITGTTTTIYEFYPGNSSLGNAGWVISSEVITISADNAVHVQEMPIITHTLSAKDNTTTMDYYVYSNDLSYPLHDSQINYAIIDPNNNVLCGTSPQASCSTAGFTVLEQGNGTNGDLTFSNGSIRFKVGFTTLGTLPEGIYKLSILAVLISPTSPGAIDWSNQPYYLTLNKGNTTNFTIAYNYQTPVLTKSIVPGHSISTDIFPFSNSPTDPHIRPGDYFEGYIHQAVYNGTISVQNAPLIATLVASNGTVYTTQLSGGFATLSYPNGLNSDINGNLLFRINLTYSAPITTFTVSFTGDYSGLQKQYPTYINSTTSSNSADYTFTVDNLYDSGHIYYEKAIPSNYTTLTTNVTTLTILFHANATTNSTYSAYASNYPATIISTSYNLYNLAVNATIHPMTSSPTPGVTLSVASGFTSHNGSYYFTNASGYIEFVLSTKYPDLYNLTTFSLDIKTDYAPMIALDPATYRFTRDIGPPVTNSSTTTSAPVTFDPHYTVVGIKYIGNNVTSNTNSFNLRPGEGAYFVYQTYNTSDNTAIGGVQFNFSIVLGFGTAGVGITTNNTLYAGSYYLSDANGLIFIFFSSTYNTTPETTTPISFSIALYLDITTFNQTKTDSNFYIGTNHKGYTNYIDYQDTWSYNNNATFNISANYLYAVPLFTAIPDSHILDPATNLIRPNNETILIRLKVVYLYGSAIIPNFNFPVNISLVTPIPGVIISNVPGFLQYGTTGYYYTNASGYIDFYLTINYQPGYSKSDTIQLSATVDFGNDTCVSGCTTHLDRWIVGENIVSGFNRSQQSYSTSNSSTYLTIHKAPVYDTGVITANPAYKSGGSPTDPLYVVPNTIINIPFTVTVLSDTNSAYDNISNAPLQGITVYLNQTLINSYGMILLNSSLTTDANGLVTFQVNVSSAADSINSPYPFYAYADFENDTGASTSIANLTGTFNYFWLNGTISTTGTVNTTSNLTIHNYSSAPATSIWVKRARVLTVTVNRIFDKNNKFVPSTTQILRGYTLELSISYFKNDSTPVSSATIDLTIQVINPITNQITDINIPSFNKTNTSGLALANLTTNNNFYVGKAGIFGSDPNLTTGTPFVANSANITIMSKLSFVSTPTITMPKNSNEGFPGEQINIAGYLRDDLGPINASSYSATVKNQIINSLLLSGYESDNLTSLGINIAGSVAFTSTFASFSLNWTIPVGYNLNSIYLRLAIPDSLNTIYFVKSNSTLFSTVGGLPVYYFNNVKVYQNINFYFSLSNSNAIGITYSGGSFNITPNYTGSITISGIITDNYGRPLANRLIQLSNGVTFISVLTNSTGGFNYVNFISQSNINSTYTITLNYLSPFNSSIINSSIASLTRTVFDIYGPVIIFNNLNNTYVYQNQNLSFTITDPDYVNGGKDYVATTGVNITSAQIDANGNLYWNTSLTYQWNGSVLFVQWNYADFLSVSSVVLNLTVRDNANNPSFILVVFNIDHINPTITNINPATSDSYPYQTNYTFIFNANDSQTGIDNTTAILQFKSTFGSISSGTNYTMTFDPNTNTFVSSTFDFYKLAQNVNIQFYVKDNAGNEGNSSVIVLLADLVKPTITLETPTNNYDVMSQIVNFSYNVSDAQSGINQSSISLYVFGNLTATSNSLTITNHGSFYTVSGNLTKNQFNLQYSTQQVSLTVSDNYGNENNLTIQLNIDNIGPDVTANSVYQPADVKVDTSTTNLTASMQYVNFQFSDSGTPTTGVDPSYIQIRLTINKTFSVVITISNNQLSVSNSSFTNDFSFTFNKSEITIGWNITNLDNYGFGKTRKVQNIPIEWSVITLHDNYGNNLTTSKDSTVSYTINIEALPTPPNPLVQLASLAFTFLIFIVIGVGAAFAFEKIRYVG